MEKYCLILCWICLHLTNIYGLPNQANKVSTNPCTDDFVCPVKESNIACNGPKNCLHPYKLNCHQFIHCDASGNKIIKDCPLDVIYGNLLLWNDNIKECDSPIYNECIQCSPENLEDSTVRYPEDSTQDYTKDSTPENTVYSTQEYQEYSTPEYIEDSTPEYIEDSTPEYIEYSTPEYLEDSTTEDPEDSIPEIPSNFTDFLLQYFNIVPAIPPLNNGETPYWVIKNEESHNKIAQQSVPKAEYDFIVVGAGSAGSVVASRLSENSSVTVLLVEYGGPENFVTDTPGAYPLHPKSLKDYAFVSVPQNNAFINMDGQRAQMTRGKSLGGSSAINGMVYLRGNPNDYDNWVKLGCEGWSYDDVLPFFKLSEHNYNTTYLANGYHGSDGLLPVTSNGINSPFNVSYKTVDACNELGFPEVDLNAATNIGTTVAQQLILNGTRVSVTKAFIENVWPRPNLDVLAYSYVTKINFSGKTATGIQLSRLGFPYTVNARIEVILSAGVIKSPQILLLSGIGPSAQLAKFNIPLVHNSSGVGDNLRDHAFCVSLAFTADQTDPPSLSIQTFAEYYNSRSGPLAHLDIPVCMGNSSVNTDTDWPDFQIAATEVGVNSDPTGILANTNLGLKLAVSAVMYLPYYDPSKSTFLLAAGVTRPKSVGTLELNSADPFDNPIINPKYLSNADDVKALIDALKWTYRLSQTNAYKSFGAKKLPSLVFGCETLYYEVNNSLFPSFKVPNDNYLECQARHMTISGLHYVGTCKMGAVNDTMAVVDPRLRVIGIQRLRVIDASIMPVITDANTNAPTIMIAEMGANFIKQDYNL